MRYMILLSSIACLLFVSIVAKAQDMRLVVFQLDAVNVDIKVAQAASMVLASELALKGKTVIDYETARNNLQNAANKGPAATTYDEEYNEIPLETPQESALSPEQLKRATARELGVTHYVDGSLVGLGRFTRLTVNLCTVDGELVATKHMQAQNEDELMAALRQAAQYLASGSALKTTPKEDQTLPEKEQDSTKRTQVEKNFGVMFGQAFGYNNIRSFSEIVFSSRLEIDYVLMDINVGVAFRQINEEDPQFIFDMAVCYYISRTQVTPYIGGGFGLFGGNRLVGPDGRDDDFQIGWNLFPTLGVELLRRTFMRVHMDFRYIFNYSGDRFGHAPMALVGVNF